MSGDHNGSEFDRIFNDGDGVATQAPGSEPPARPRRKKRRGWLWLLLALVLVVVLLVVAVLAYAAHLGRQWDKGTDRVDASEVFGPDVTAAPEPTGTGTNVLLLGSDSRSEDVDYSSSTGVRSDTILVAHIPDDGSGIQIMSIPRDMWVEVEGHGEAKINAAMSYGGLPLTTQTVGDFIGADIHHVAIIDFEGFKDLTDALGGVTVDSEQAFESGGYSFSEGSNTLDGEAALAFVRARKNFADGDFQRARNQQAFLKGVIDKVMSPETLSNPQKVSETVGKFSPYITVDDGLDSGTIAGLAVSLRDYRTDGIDFFTAPVAGTGRSDDGQSIVLPDEDALEEMRTAFAEDTVADYAENAEEAHL
ncbi:LCP family protein [Brevibacterium samyangense]|uniref:Cell envelope-related transcriptional attenuator domain-containing protein n=1 Tax=Brevibacterium samyangense TaxID=366888 RepID=A0ABN2TDH5_9MICO